MNKLLRLFLLAVMAAPAAAAEPHAYRANRIWPGDGQPYAGGAVLVVQDGKVVAVGKAADVKIPAGAIIHDLGDATIIPGLIAGETSLADKGRDDLHALTPHHRAIDGFDYYADFSGPLSGGVTTVQIAPGAKRLLPGQCAVVKLFGADPETRTLREVESLRVMLGDAFKNPPKIYEPPVGAVSVDRPLEATRPQLAASLASAVAGLRASFQAARADPHSRDPFLRAVGSAGGAKEPLRVTAPGAADVQAALALAKEFDLRLILAEPNVSKDKLAAWKDRVTGVVLSCGIRPGAVGDDTARVPVEAARDLRAAGLPVALKPVLDADLKDLLYLASLFTTHISQEQALRMVTADAAALLRVADRVGTLAPGKDADFVVLGGELFGLHTRVRAVYVEGERAYEAKGAGATKVVRAARVLTGNGETIANGSILIEGKTIRAIGRDVSLPSDAEEKRFANAVIVPGCLDMGTGLGLGGAPIAPIAFGTKLGDRLLPSDPAVKTVRQGGTTTVLLSGPAPSSVLAFKLGERLRVVKEPVALKFALRGNLTSAGPALRDQLRTGKAYADAWAKYEADLPVYEIKKKEFDEAQAKAAAAKKDEKKDDKKPDEKKPEPPKAPDKPQMVESFEPYRALFAGKIPALVEAKREDAIRLAVAICRDEFGVRMALVGADDAYRVADLLATKSVTVIVGPELVRMVDRDDVNLPLALAVRGVPFGFQSNATSGAKNLPLAVGYAVRGGLGAGDALRGLTATPAQLLGLESVGVLTAGKDADLVVLSGMPFEAATRVLAVMIDGQWVFQGGE
jgi:imidazolonepropionase-like amidohydrolase